MSAADDIRARLDAALRQRYSVERELGRGGMATVFLAHDLKHGRSVAIKVLHPELAHAIGTERFLREIRTTARLQHPGILALHDSGEADGLLYYIMPFVQGESLRDLLRREKRLPVSEAVRLARQVAEALAYAHAQGIVHRDIKPENILLPTRQHASLADFGLARALSSAANTPLTVSGIILGSPSYMSPEQAAGDAEVDARADIYSLGCVLFEMLTGVPPFQGPTFQAVISKHIVQAPPPVRAHRPDVPEWLEGVVAKTMAKDPRERYGNAEELAAALESELPGRPPSRSVRRAVRPRVAIAGLAALAVGLVIVAAWPETGALGGVIRRTRVDSTRYVVFPFEGGANGKGALNEQTLLHDALSRWSGITLVDLFQVDDALERAGNKPLTSRSARQVAARLGAGRYIRGQILEGEPAQARVTLFDNDGKPLTSFTERIGHGQRPDSVFAALADRVLMRIAAASRMSEGDFKTRSVPAYGAYSAGLDAMRDWNLPRAESLFATATRADPDFARAHLMLAQVRSWSSDRPVAWELLASRAVAGRDQLAPREQHLAQAALHMARSEFPQACAEYRQVIEAEPNDFAAWYGLGECQRRDDLVIPDSTSSSGWSFRSSYFRALLAYKRAFEILPSAHRAFSASAYSRFRQLFFTRTNVGREGRSATSAARAFRASPAWISDSLAFVPQPSDLIGTLDPKASATSAAIAVTHTRAMFRELAGYWAREFPKSSNALEALGIALQLTGEATGADTLAKAADLATDPGETARLNATALLFRVRYALPDRVSDLQKIRSAADSLFRARSEPNRGASTAEAALAALTGRIHLAATLSRRDADSFAREAHIAVPIASDGLALLAYVGVGAPIDSIGVLEKRISQMINRTLLQEDARRVRPEMLGRPASIAFPYYQSPYLSVETVTGDYLLEAEWNYLQGQHATMRNILERVRIDRRTRRPSDITLDALYAEAWLLFASGEVEAAIGWLDPTLGELPGLAPGALETPVTAGVLMRIAALRAELARRAGDSRTAERWATAVVTLWKHADGELQPVVKRMKSIAATKQ